MKQRSAMIAVGTALLLSVGVVLSLAMGSEVSGDEYIMSPPSRPSAGATPVRPWPQAAEVRLFVEDLSYDDQEKMGKWTSRPEGIRLTKAQRDILDGSVFFYRLTKKEWAERVHAACFIPHHFFRYYDGSGRQLGEIQVCYCCQGVGMTPALRRTDSYDEWQFDFPRVEKMLHEMGVRTDLNCDG
ncbi:MAG: hypothetical protein KAF42_01770 [Sphingopyxis terrae]|nr:hypothetical protein [Sphingopyxis terrae]